MKTRNPFLVHAALLAYATFLKIVYNMVRWNCDSWRFLRQVSGMRKAALLRLHEVSVLNKPQCYAAYGVAFSCYRDRITMTGTISCFGTSRHHAALDDSLCGRQNGIKGRSNWSKCYRHAIK